MVVRIYNRTLVAGRYPFREWRKGACPRERLRTEAHYCSIPSTGEVPTVHDVSLKTEDSSKLKGCVKTEREVVIKSLQHKMTGWWANMAHTTNSVERLLSAM